MFSVDVHSDLLSASNSAIFQNVLFTNKINSLFSTCLEMDKIFEISIFTKNIA